MLEAFMWGYWGWGGSTSELVGAFDAAERRRGFKPPVFVDCRARRAVRAKGFRGDAFELLLGAKRYRWMKGLGNNAILHGGAMQLIDRDSVAELVDVIVAAGATKRRVLFFCACERPRRNGERNCHRDLVGELVVAEAKRRRLALAVVEWPGGVPFEVTGATVKAAAARAALRTGALTVPVPPAMNAALAASLPWGSILRDDSPDATPLIVGPALHAQGRWAFPCLSAGLDEAPTPQALARHVRSLRRDWGFEPRFSKRP